MGGRWSIEARNLHDECWEVCDYNLIFIKWFFKGLYCICKYDVVIMGKHG